MLLMFFLQQKQWARLVRGLTVASISPQCGHRKRKYPSLIFDGGPARPRAATVTCIGRSLRMRRSKSAEIMVFSTGDAVGQSCPGWLSVIGQVGLLLPV